MCLEMLMYTTQEYMLVVCRWLHLLWEVTTQEFPRWGKEALDWCFGTQTYLVLSMPHLHTTTSRQQTAFRTLSLMTLEVSHNISVISKWTKEKYMSYATGQNSFTRQYLLNTYNYCRFCRLCIINCEKKINHISDAVAWHVRQSLLDWHYFKSPQFLILIILLY
jgi:hypothetical protein